MTDPPSSSDPLDREIKNQSKYIIPLLFLAVLFTLLSHRLAVWSHDESVRQILGQTETVIQMGHDQ